MTEQEAWPPEPAREELNKPRLDAEELEEEIGDSEEWDESSHEEKKQ